MDIFIPTLLNSFKFLSSLVHLIRLIYYFDNNLRNFKINSFTLNPIFLFDPGK